MSDSLTVQLSPLIQKAIDTLTNAKTCAEVLDARNQAHTALAAAQEAEHRARVTHAAQEVVTECHKAQAQALDIESQAKIRLADEYDAAKARHEVQSKGGDRKSSKIKVGDTDFDLPKLVDIGLTKQEVSEARKLRDAEEKQPGVIRKTLEAELALGKPPSRTALNKAVKQVIGTSTTVGSGRGSGRGSGSRGSGTATRNTKRLTPEELFAKLEENYDPNSLSAHIYQWTLAQFDDGVYATEGTATNAFPSATTEKGPGKAMQLGYWPARAVWKDRYIRALDKSVGEVTSLSPTAQERLKQHERRLDDEYAKRMAELESESWRNNAAFEQRVQDELRRVTDEVVLPSYHRELKELRDTVAALRKGVFTANEYRDLLACLHPDRVEGPFKKKHTEVFQRVTNLRLMLIKADEEPLPSTAVPRNYTDMMAARERVRQERSARRRGVPRA